LDRAWSIDSLLRPVYGRAKQGASYGHTKIAGKQVLRKGLSPLATTISTPACAPVIAGMRLRAGKTGSGKGAGRMVAQAIATARGRYRRVLTPRAPQDLVAIMARSGIRGASPSWRRGARRRRRDGR
jgi:hypothetical protein